jgi:hypothetical protein
VCKVTSCHFLAEHAIGMPIHFGRRGAKQGVSCDHVGINHPEASIASCKKAGNLVGWERRALRRRITFERNSVEPVKTVVAGQPEKAVRTALTRNQCAKAGFYFSEPNRQEIDPPTQDTMRIPTLCSFVPQSKSF